MASSSQFWENSGGVDNAGGAKYALKVNRDSIVMRVAKLLRGKGNRKIAGLMKALNGAAAGSDATETYKRVAEKTQFADAELGGLRTIETRTIIDRATTSTDETLLDKLTDQKFKPTTYPVDLSGNGYDGNTDGKAGRV